MNSTDNIELGSDQCGNNRNVTKYNSALIKTSVGLIILVIILFVNFFIVIIPEDSDLRHTVIDLLYRLAASQVTAYSAQKDSANNTSRVLS